MTTPLVLVHGGGFDSRCWDLLVPQQLKITDRTEVEVVAPCNGSRKIVARVGALATTSTGHSPATPVAA